jgi:hypothetical protein
MGWPYRGYINAVVCGASTRWYPAYRHDGACCVRAPGVEPAARDPETGSQPRMAARYTTGMLCLPIVRYGGVAMTISASE